MAVIKCFKCKGKGYIKHYDWFMGVCTAGLTLLMQASDNSWNDCEECDACKGKGFLIINEGKNE